MTLSSCSPAGRGSALRLREDTQFLGPYEGSGAIETPYLIRRSDRRIVEVSHLLYLLASMVDGVRQSDEIGTLLSTELRRQISTADIEHLVSSKLCPLGLIEQADASATSRVGPLVGKVAARKAVVPAVTVGKAAAVLRPLFRPAVIVAITGILVAVDCWLFLGHHLDEGVERFLHQPALLMMAIGLTVLAAAFHELGHATACRYGDAEPGAIGIGIYLLWPVFYNDVTDAYRLNRWGRLRADLGGVYFNILFILVLVGAYAIIGYQPLLVVAAAHHLLILQQLLPFVRLDGYYVVSDLAGVPDLFRYVRPVLCGLAPGRAPAPVLKRLRPGPRIVVTAWVLVTIPLLSFCAAALLIRLPNLLVAGGEAATLHAAALARAVHSGSPLHTALSGLQLVFLAVPLAGLGIVAAGAARWAGRMAGLAVATAVRRDGSSRG